MAAVAATLLILSLLGRDFDAETSQQAWEAPQEPPKYGSAPVAVRLCMLPLVEQIECTGVGRLQEVKLAWHALKQLIMRSKALSCMQLRL